MPHPARLPLASGLVAAALVALAACSGGGGGGSFLESSTTARERATTTTDPLAGPVPESLVEQIERVVCGAGELSFLELPYVATSAYLDVLGLSTAGERIDFTRVDPECEGITVVARLGPDPGRTDLGDRIGDEFRIRISEPRPQEGWVSLYTACSEAFSPVFDVNPDWPVCVYSGLNPEGRDVSDVHEQLLAIPEEVPQLDTDGEPDLVIEVKHASLSGSPCFGEDTAFGAPLLRLVNQGTAASPREIEISFDGAVEVPAFFRGLEPGEGIPLRDTPAGTVVVVDPGGKIAETDDSNNRVVAERGAEFECVPRG